jgi:hypothetical protein
MFLILPNRRNDTLLLNLVKPSLVNHVCSHGRRIENSQLTSSTATMAKKTQRSIICMYSQCVGAVPRAEANGIPRLAGAKGYDFEQFAHFVLIDEFQGIRTIR